MNKNILVVSAIAATMIAASMPVEATSHLDSAEYVGGGGVPVVTPPQGLCEGQFNTPETGKGIGRACVETVEGGTVEITDLVHGPWPGSWWCLNGDGGGQINGTTGVGNINRDCGTVIVGPAPGAVAGTVTSFA